MRVSHYACACVHARARVCVCYFSGGILVATWQECVSVFETILMNLELSR